MNHAEKIEWMHRWCAANNATLTLEGECGFGRECVGILVGDHYPDYTWYDDQYERIDQNGEVFTPPNAYHKHECVAVLGRGEEAETQLYDWLVWFNANGFKVMEGEKDTSKMHPLEMLMHGRTWARMVRTPTTTEAK